MAWSDAQICAQVFAGNIDAYTTLYEQYKKSIYNYIRQFSNYDQEATDTITTDVFITLFNYCQKNIVTNFRSLAYTTARRLSINWFEKHKNVSYVSNDEQRDTFVDEKTLQANEQLERNYRQEKLTECLRYLKSEYREVLYLYYFEQKDYQSIGELIGMTKNTVWTMISRAKKKLHTIIEQQWLLDVFTDYYQDNHEKDT